MYTVWGDRTGAKRRNLCLFRDQDSLGASRGGRGGGKGQRETFIRVQRLRPALYLRCLEDSRQMAVLFSFLSSTLNVYVNKKKGEDGFKCGDFESRKVNPYMHMCIFFFFVSERNYVERYSMATISPPFFFFPSLFFFFPPFLCLWTLWWLVSVLCRYT